jgi:hypothetical protein
MKSAVQLLFFLMTVLLWSCTHEGNVDDVREIHFSSDIQPLIAANCSQAGCHSSTGDGEFSLIGYDNVIENGDVKAGDAHGSKLYKVVSNNDDDIMPPAPADPLNTDQIKLLYIWIEQGAKNN